MSKHVEIIITPLTVNGTVGPNKTLDVWLGDDPSLPDYDPRIFGILKDNYPSRWVKSGRLWRMPLDLSLGKRLRKEFGEQFIASPSLKKWAMREAEVATTLRAISSGEAAELDFLYDLCPDLFEALYLGPIGKTYDDAKRKEMLDLVGEVPGSFQLPDTKFVAECPFPINANQPGLGKTLEAIGSVFEAGLEDGPKLVIAPLTSLEVVWGDELVNWQYQDVILCIGSKGKRHRQEAIDAAVHYQEQGEPFWFVTNYATVQYQAIHDEDEMGRRTGKKQLWLKHPELHDINWNIVILDEFHQAGLGNPDSMTARGCYDLKRQKGHGMSGTPIQGKPIKLFGILKFLDPERHTSKWNWADQWLVVDNTGRYGKRAGDVRKEREEEFWEMIGKYMIRRTKGEVTKWLPPKQYVNIWAEMEGHQRKQYETFADLAELRIEEESLKATSILAEYTRLKQFAIAVQRIESIRTPPYVKPFPTTDSCKLPHLEELLKERGIIQTGEAGEEVEAEQQVVIFSQFTTVVDMVFEWLQKKGVRVARITGDVSQARRTEVVRAFQSEDSTDRPQVCVINTKAGGVSITLDNADTVIFMDETWVPDDQEQAEDRIHRVSRIHQVTVYYIRTRGTIEEAIYNKVQRKANINSRILDLRREGLRAKYTEADRARDKRNQEVED